MRKTIIILIQIILILMLYCETKGQNGFITIWDTTKEGLGNENQILLPLRGTYTINWFEKDNPINKETKENCINNVFITFPKPGIYQIIAIGKIKTMNFAYYTLNSIPTYGEKNYKLLSVESWGGIEWESFDSFFYKCKNFTINTTEAPNLSKVKSCRQLFCEAENFNDSIGHWDMSHVEDMSYLFYDAEKFNSPINNWNVSNVKTMHSMFGHAESFNQALNMWNVSNVSGFSAMFWKASNFNQDLNNWNVSNATNLSRMFFEASSFNQSLKNWKINDNCLISHKMSSGEIHGLFKDSGMSDINIRKTLVSWGKKI